MSELQAESPKQEKRPQRKVQLKKIDPETAKLLSQLRERVNRKSVGRKVKDIEIIRAGLKLIGNDQILELQEASYSERDRLQLIHESYQKENGRITLDQFIGKLMRGEVRAAKESE